jgi:hypothetical protein
MKRSSNPVCSTSVAPRQKGFPPAFERFGVVVAKGHFFHHHQSGRLCLTAELTRAGQAATGEDVLLYEVGGADIAFKQGVINHDALHAGVAHRA